jgi:hypothetical protein
MIYLSATIHTKEKKMQFIYPMELKVGDKITVADEDGRWTETIQSEPERLNDKVHLWTDKRHMFFDPGLKVQVSSRLA